MTKKQLPLNYAIMKLFEDGKQRCAEDVVRELEPTFGGYKLLTAKDVDETLATAKENGLMDEVGAEVSGSGNLRIFFQLNDYGREMTERYIG